MHYCTFLFFFAISIYGATAAPTPLVHGINEFEARYYGASIYDNYKRDQIFDNKFSVLVRSENNFEEISARDESCHWVGLITSPQQTTG